MNKPENEVAHEGHAEADCSVERPSVIPPDKAFSWWCPECRKWVQNEHVTFEEIHDPKCGGCGCGVK